MSIGLLFSISFSETLRPLLRSSPYYQRLLAGDASEIADQAEQFLKTDSLVKYCDDVALKALLMAHADLRRGVLDEVRQIRIKETVEEVLEDLSDHVDPSQASVTPKGTDVAAIKLNGSPNPDPAPNIETENSPSPEIGSESQTSVLCVSGRSFLDEAAAMIFARILGSHGIASTVEPAEALTITRIPHLVARGAQIICLSYLEADTSRANVRFAIKRLRRRLPESKILVGFWKTDTGKARDLCAVTMADSCAATFKDALDICLGKTVEKPQAETKLS